MEPSSEQYIAAVRAFHEVEKELDLEWVAHKPIQGEATAKVFAYRIAVAVLSHLGRSEPRDGRSPAGPAGSATG